MSPSSRRVGAARPLRAQPPQDDAAAALRGWLRLLDCTTLVENEVRRRLHTQFHTTLPRFDVLAQLDLAHRQSVPGLTMSELSRRLMVTNGWAIGPCGSAPCCWCTPARIAASISTNVSMRFMGVPPNRDSFAPSDSRPSSSLSHDFH